MTPNSFISEGSSRDKTVFPLCLLPQTYGTTLFWAEEYWTIMKIRELRKMYPHLDLSGLIDPNFMQEFPNFIKRPIHENCLYTRRFDDISSISWEDNRQILNISTSHAPSRFIAEAYWDRFGGDFGIITFDAHLDLSTSQKIHGAWITEDLASITVVIGGWADTSHDVEEAANLFPFIESDLPSAISNRDLQTWLKDRKIYLNIDLDYYQLSHRDYLGYSNFWHRNKFIGHSMTIKQILAEHFEEYQMNSSFLLGKLLCFFSNLNEFTQRKKESLKNQTTEITNTLTEITSLCHKNSATLLALDFVEYSPICDWHQMTIYEFIRNYSRFQSIIHP
ncbi:MAG: hypothetical protein ACFFFH_09185 [Candidatus Thorarchaeota archaeon]